MRFRLRTLMIVLAIGPPLIAGIFNFHYRNWRALRALRALEQAQIKRDTVLNTWRATYDRRGEGQEEAAIRPQYYKALEDFNAQKASIEVRYGSREAAMRMGAQAQRFER